MQAVEQDYVNSDAEYYSDYDSDETSASKKKDKKKSKKLKNDITENDYESVVKIFEYLNLKVKIVPTPQEFFTKKVWGDRDTKSFLMDIRKHKKKGKTDNTEHYIIYPGENTNLNVIAFDKKLNQMIFSVVEPEREMKVTQREWNKTTLKYEMVTVIHRTVPDEKRFLIGKDEMHLFIAQLPFLVNKVSEAHKLLKPQKLKNIDKNYYRRQGEWFFTPIDFNPYSLSENFRYENNFGLRVGTGRAHLAECYLRTMNRTFVKGSITHPDHKTIHLKGWHEVFANNEKRDAAISGSRWID